MPPFAYLRGRDAGNIQYDPYAAAIVSIKFLKIRVVDCVEMFCEVLSDAAPCLKQFTSIGFACRFSANLAIQRINLCEEHAQLTKMLDSAWLTKIFKLDLRLWSSRDVHCATTKR